MKKDGLEQGYIHLNEILIEILKLSFSNCEKISNNFYFSQACNGQFRIMVLYE